MMTLNGLLQMRAFQKQSVRGTVLYIGGKRRLPTSMELKALLMFAIPFLFLLSGCPAKNYSAYEDDNSCMKLCYGERPECGKYSGDLLKGHPADYTLHVLSGDYLTLAYCLALLDGCREGCGLEGEDEVSDQSPTATISCTTTLQAALVVAVD